MNMTKNVTNRIGARFGNVHIVRLVKAVAFARSLTVLFSKKSMKKDRDKGKNTKHHMKPPKS
jgi:hypothetical protein